MGRRANALAHGGKISGITSAPSTTATRCNACSKHLPRSAFSKAELGRGGGGRCRNCAQRVQCEGCNVWLLPEKLEGNSRCRRCQENVQVDRLLQTPKDEVTHFGAFRALRLQREAEHAMLLACYKFGLWERMVLQRILDFLRVPFVTSHDGIHYCELCDKAFSELSVLQGQQVQMAMSHKQVDWTNCPGACLVFHAGESYTVAELLKTRSDRWFFRTLAVNAAATTAQRPRSSSTSDTLQACKEERDHSPELDTEEACSHPEITGVPAMYRSSPLKPCMYREPATAGHHNAAMASRFETFWAPLDATAQGKKSSQLLEHLQSKEHQAYDESVAAGTTFLVSRAAIELAGKLKERPTTALSRFRVGLGLNSRFCQPSDIEKASTLERVRDLDMPVKFLREVLADRQDFLWITPEELHEAEEKYEKRKKRGSRKCS